MRTEWYKMVLRTSVILSSIAIISGIKLPCDEMYRAENGHMCYPCSPGNYKVSDCVVDGEQPRCRPCLEGTFMPNCDNAERCEFCRQFCPDKRHVMVKNCTSISDIQCQCKTGYWRPHSHDQSHGECIAHQKCKAGEGLVEKGTLFADTKCNPCVKGMTFSNSSSFDVCNPCSLCDMSVVKKNCTAKQDTICLLDIHIPHSEDTSSVGLDIVVIVVVIILSILALAVIVGLAFILVRRYHKKRIQAHKSGHVERGVSDDISRIQVNECQVIPTSPVSSNFIIKDEKTRQCPNATSEADPDESFDNQAFEPDPGDYLEMRRPNVGGQDQTDIVRHKLGQTCTYHDNIENDSGNETEPTRDSYGSNQTDSSFDSETLNKNIEIKVNETKKDLADVENSLLQDSDLTVDASAVPARCMSSDTDNQNLSASQGMERGQSLEMDPSERGQSLEIDPAERGQSLEIDPAERGQSLEIDPAERGQSSEIDPAERGQSLEIDPAERGQSLSKNFYNVALESNQGVKGSVDTSDFVISEIDSKRRQSIQQSTIIEEEVFFEVFDFLQRHMIFKDFKMFIRRLTSNTNRELHKTIEAIIENSGEGNITTNERIYQILTKWRQATPKSKLEDVLIGLRHYKFDALSNDLIRVLKEKKILDKWYAELCTGAPCSAEEKIPLSEKEHSTKDSDIRNEESNVSEEVQEMNVLKSYVDESSFQNTDIRNEESCVEEYEKTKLKHAVDEPSFKNTKGKNEETDEVEEGQEIKERTPHVDVDSSKDAFIKNEEDDTNEEGREI